MSDYSWWPGLIVLAMGLAAGIFLALRIRRSAKIGRPEDLAAKDLALKIRDLEGRRDDLYRRLREEGDSLTDAEIAQLEQAAARTLRDLDGLRSEEGKKARKQKQKKVAKASPAADAKGTAPASPPPSLFGRRPLMTGFLFGAGMVGVVGMLIYFAVRDTAGTGVPSPPPTTEEAAHPDVNLSPEAKAEYDALASRLAQEPGDVMARKKLALLLLAQEEFFGAFREAQTLLAADPQDIDGLYVEAVVRLQMGQIEPAVARFDQVLSLFADHVQALAWRGIALYQTGDIAAAVASWQRGIEAAGGQHPELEEMVHAALDEQAGRAAAGQPTGVAALMVDPGPSAPPPSAAPPSTPPESSTAEGFDVRVELAAGAQAPAGVLFVALRSSPGTPPLAVRRIPSPTLPLNLRLTADDSMMGAELPEAGWVTVRLDQDGDVRSTSPGDLAGEAEVSRDSSVTILLNP